MLFHLLPLICLQMLTRPQIIQKTKEKDTDKKLMALIRVKSHPGPVPKHPWTQRVLKTLETCTSMQKLNKSTSTTHPNVFTSCRLKGICASESWLISSAGETQNMVGRTTKAIYFPAALSPPKRGTASVFPLKFTCPWRSTHDLIMVDFTSNFLGQGRESCIQVQCPLFPYIFQSPHLLTYWNINKKPTLDCLI